MSGINDWEPMTHVLRFCDGEKRVIEVLQFTRSFKVFKVMFNHRRGDHLLEPSWGRNYWRRGSFPRLQPFNLCFGFRNSRVSANSICYTNDFVTSIFNLDKGTSSTQLDSQTS